MVEVLLLCVPVIVSASGEEHINFSDFSAICLTGSILTVVLAALAFINAGAGFGRITERHTVRKIKKIKAMCIIFMLCFAFGLTFLLLAGASYIEMSPSIERYNDFAGCLAVAFFMINIVIACRVQRLCKSAKNITRI